MAMRIFQGAGPAILAAVFVIGWGFGLYYLFKTKNWDALTRPLPLAIVRDRGAAGRAQHDRQFRRLPEPARRRRGRRSC